MDLGVSICGPIRATAAKRRQRIVDAARILFVENGFHATGVAQIAKASGVAVGQIYRDFEAKEDIVASIVEGDCGRLMARECLHEAIAAADVEAVWSWIHQFVQPAEHRDTEQLFAEIIAEAARNERIAAIFARTREDVSASMLAALALLAPGDVLAERRAALCDLILTQSLGFKQQRLLQPGLDVERLTKSILDVIRHEIGLLQRADASLSARKFRG